MDIKCTLQLHCLGCSGLAVYMCTPFWCGYDTYLLLSVWRLIHWGGIGAIGPPLPAGAKCLCSRTKLFQSSPFEIQIFKIFRTVSFLYIWCLRCIEMHQMRTNFLNFSWRDAPTPPPQGEGEIPPTGSAFILECNDKHDKEGNPLLQYSITAWMNNCGTPSSLLTCASFSLYTVFCVTKALVRSQGYIRLHGSIADILSFPTVVSDWK